MSSKEALKQLSSLMKELKETSPRMVGEISDWENGKETWAMDLNDENEPVINIDCLDKVLLFTLNDLQQMLSAVEFMSSIDQEQRRLLLTMLDYGQSDD